MIKPYYEDDNTTIYNCDCRELIPQLKQVDMILTDPPFSSYTHKNAKSNKGKGHGNIAIDFEAIDFEAIEEIFISLANICPRWLVSFMDYRQIVKLQESPPESLEFMRFGVWVKTNPMPQISADRPGNGWDGIAYLHNKNSKRYWNGGGKHGNYIGPVITDGLHPTQKPIPFLRTLIERFTDNSTDIIFDPFMGSGSTLIAARQTGRKGIACEIDKSYCEVAAKRLRQQTLF